MRASSAWKKSMVSLLEPDQVRYGEIQAGVSAL